MNLTRLYFIVFDSDLHFFLKSSFSFALRVITIFSALIFPCVLMFGANIGILNIKKNISFIFYITFYCYIRCEPNKSTMNYEKHFQINYIKELTNLFDIKIEKWVAKMCDAELEKCEPVRLLRDNSHNYEPDFSFDEESFKDFLHDSREYASLVSSFEDSFSTVHDNYDDVMIYTEDIAFSIWAEHAHIDYIIDTYLDRQRGIEE